MPELALRLVHHPIACAGLGQIRPDRHELAGKRARRARQVIKPGRFAIDPGDAVAFPQKTKRDRPADAARCPGHDGCLA